MQRVMIVSVIIGFFISGVAEGQTHRRTYSNFRKLESYAQRIDEIVRRFNDRQSAKLMRKAHDEIDLAGTYLFATEPPEIAMAQVSMLRARKYIDQAAGSVLQKPFGNLKFQLDDLINRAEKATMQVSNDEANYLLNQAKRFRRRAYDNYKSGNPVKAQEFYRVSYFFAKKCIDYSGNENQGIRDQLLDLEISVQQMIEQGEEILQNDNDPYMVSQLAEARKYYEEAVEMADRGETEQAVRRFRLIKRLLYRLYDQAERGGLTEDERITDDLYALRIYLESLHENADISGGPGTEKLLNQADRHYKEAEKAYRKGDYQKSAREISHSQRIANQLFKSNKRELKADPETLNSQLEETRRVLEKQKTSVQNSGSASTGQLWQDAHGMLDRAGSKISSGQNAVAFQLIQAATRMSVRIQKELKNKSGSDQAEELLITYKQIVDMIDRVRQGWNIKNEWQNILIQINEFAETGKIYLDQGEFILADEYLKTAMQQIIQFTARWRKKVTE